MPVATTIYAYYDFAIGRYVVAPGNWGAIPPFEFKRATSYTFKINFLSGGATENIEVFPYVNVSTGQLVLKVAGEYDGQAIVADLAWTVVANQNAFSFTLDFSGTALDALFNVDGDPANDKDLVVLMGAIRFDGNLHAGETAEFVANVRNNVVRGDESTPLTPVPSLAATTEGFIPTITQLVGTAATGTITSDNTNVANGDTVTIGGKTYVYKNALTTEGDVKIGANADASLLNLIRAINHSGTPGTDYQCAAANTQVTAATSVTAHAFAVTAKQTGTTGNAIPLFETSAHLSWAAATLTGGVDGLDDQPTAALALTRLVSLVRNVSGSYTKGVWYLVAWDTTTTAANEATSSSRGIVIPTDFNSSTNAKMWVRVDGL
jgi:hypothetical protein